MSNGSLPSPVPASEYGVLMPVSVNFYDLDPYGVVHSSRYSLLVDQAWDFFWAGQGYAPGAKSSGDEFLVIKDFHIIFDSPISKIGMAAVNLWIDRVGRSSATAGFRICSPDEITTFAHGTRTVVRLDPTNFRPVEWSTGVRKIFQDTLQRAAEEES